MGAACLSSAGSCRHGPLPVPSSSGAGSFSVRVFCHFRWDKVKVIWFSFSLFIRPVFESSLRQHSPCLETRNIAETNQYHSVSPWLCLFLPCPAAVHAPWPRLPCCSSSTAVCALAMVDAALFPWLPPCWPWPVFVLVVPLPAGPVFDLGLRWQRPGPATAGEL